MFFVSNWRSSINIVLKLFYLSTLDYIVILFTMMHESMQCVLIIWKFLLHSPSRFSHTKTLIRQQLAETPTLRYNYYYFRLICGFQNVWIQPKSLCISYKIGNIASPCHLSIFSLCYIKHGSCDHQDHQINSFFNQRTQHDWVVIWCINLIVLLFIHLILIILFTVSLLFSCIYKCAITFMIFFCNMFPIFLNILREDTHSSAKVSA